MTDLRAPRLLVAAVLAAVLAVACTTTGPEVDQVPVDGPDSPAASPPTAGPSPSPTTGTAPTEGQAGQEQPGGGSSPQDADGQSPAPGGQDGADGADGLTPVNDGGGVGANGRAMLRGDRATLVLEVDVQSGASVDDAAVSHLVDVLEQVVDKPGGVQLAGGNSFDSDRTRWSTDDLRAAARANRSTASTDEQVSAHVLYVRGSHVDDGEQTEAIGLAHSASTVALFPERWSGLGSLLGSSRAIERAVLVHELGHLFGLVNLTYTSEIDHEDPEHPGHSDNRDSVMFHAIETTAIGQAFSGPPPDTFDADDRADLEGLRTGRY